MSYFSVATERPMKKLPADIRELAIFFLRVLCYVNYVHVGKSVLVESVSGTDEHNNSNGQHGNLVLRCSCFDFPESPQRTLHRVFIGGVTHSMYNYSIAPLQRQYFRNIPRCGRNLPVTI